MSHQEVERQRLTALGGLAALSLDALSSVAYGAQLGIGQVPPPPVKRASLVVVPVAGLSRLTAEGISAAMSLGDDAVAVTVAFTDSDDEPAPEVSFRDEWTAWRPEVPLVTLPSGRRSIAKPIVSFLRQVEAEDRYHRLVVLIPEVHPARPWQWLLHNQRGVLLDRAIRRAPRTWCSAGCGTGSRRSPRALSLARAPRAPRVPRAPLGPRVTRATLRPRVTRATVGPRVP